jgi:uncharacterized protein YceH (UPF0502 family)
MTKAERDDLELRIAETFTGPADCAHVNVAPLAAFLVQMLARHDELKDRVEALETEIDELRAELLG